MKRIATVVFGVVCFFLCSASYAQGPCVLDAELLAAQQDYEATWTAPRTELRFEGTNATAVDCASYTALSSRHPIEESTWNMIHHSEYLECDALRLLGETPTGTCPADGEYGKRLAAGLDLRSFPSSMHQRCTENKYTLETLFPGRITHTAAAAELNSEDWHYGLEVVALADLNDNGMADWIVWLADEALQGTYRGYQTLVVLDPEDNREFRATAWPWKE